MQKHSNTNIFKSAVRSSVHLTAPFFNGLLTLPKNIQNLNMKELQSPCFYSLFESILKSLNQCVKHSDVRAVIRD